MTQVRDALDRASREALQRQQAVRELEHARAQVAALEEQLRRTYASRSHRLLRRLWRLKRRRREAAVAAAAIVAAGVVVGVLAGVVAGILAALAALVGAGLALARATRLPPGDRPPQVSAAAPYLHAAANGAPAARTLAPASARAVDPERAPWLPPRRIDPGELRVAAVMDEMSRACFEPECELLTFGMHDWRDVLAARRPDLLLVESAWNGNGGTWQYGVGSYAHPQYAGLPQLGGLVDWCRANDIPTVFWNKEDPVHFERFKEAAALFDHILTTDSDRIPLYEALGGRHVQSVGALPFAAQPWLHNPVGAPVERRPEPVFAGTYYRNRHQSRRASLEMILDAARPHGLVIYDRTFGTTADEYGFPERFIPHIQGRLPYDRVLDVYKSHKLFVNVNSVTESPTMFSRRVYELLACGTAVISTESRGIEETFGDLVPVVSTPEQAAEALERWLRDDEHRVAMMARARRLVIGSHTYRDRLATIAGIAGFEVDARTSESLTVLAALGDSGEAGALAATLRGQTAPLHEVVAGVPAPAADAVAETLRGALAGVGVRTLVQNPAVAATERLRELAALAAAPWVVLVAPGAAYPPEHLTDLLLATRYTDADVLGLAPGSPQRYVDAVAPDGVIARRELVALHGWPAGEGAASAMAERFGAGVRFFSGG